MKSDVGLLINMLFSVRADHQSRESLLYITFYFHLCHRYFGDVVVRIGEMDGGEMSSFGLLEMFLLTFFQCFKVY
jgi:hypothetical protein